MALQLLGEYRTDAPTSAAVDKQTRKLLCDKHGQLLTKTAVSFREDNQHVAGALSTTGKLGTVAASATTIIALDCSDFPIESVDWAVAFDNSWDYYLARSNSNPLSATITLTDATAVDNGDTFVLNGVTWTAKTSGAVAASHEYNLGANNAAAAVNLAAALAGAYGPGVSCTITSPTTTDVIAIAATTASVLQFAQGTSDANEIAWAETTKLNCNLQSHVTGKTTTAAWKYEDIPPHYIDGWGFAVLVLVNAEASTATLDVKATRH